MADEAYGVVASPDGSLVYVTGRSADRSASDSIGFEVATVAYDADTGAEVWVSRYDGSPEAAAWNVRVNPDGSDVYVSGVGGSGRGRGVPAQDFLTVAYDARTGTQRWVAHYDGPGGNDDHATSLAVSPRGSTVYVSGESRSGSDFPSADFATVAYDATLP